MDKERTHSSNVTVREASLPMTYDKTVEWQKINNEQDTTLLLSPLAEHEDSKLFDIPTHNLPEIGSGKDGTVFALPDNERVIKQLTPHLEFSGEEEVFATLAANESLRVGLERTKQKGPWRIGGAAILGAQLRKTKEGLETSFLMERVASDYDSELYIPTTEEKRKLGRQALPAERKRLSLYNKAMRATGVPHHLLPFAPREYKGTTIVYDDNPSNLMISDLPSPKRFGKTGNVTKIDTVARAHFRPM